MQKILVRNIKNIAFNYTEAQIKVREATSNDAWGPSALMLTEITELTYNVVEFPKIMEMIYRRLNDSGKNWRHVKKALIVMEHLAKTGIEKCVKQFKENIHAIESLRDFSYYEDGKDYGRQVREKANHLINFLNDNERLRNERLKALKAKENFARYSVGIGYNDVRFNTELEAARPKTYDEEEMQLKLALDLSREEAIEESLKRRSDEVRLKMALEESERKEKAEKEAKEAKEKPTSQSHMLDLLDISLGAASSSSQANTANTDPWIALAKRQDTTNKTNPDPWLMNQKQQQNADPWQAATSKGPFNTSATAAPPAYGWLYPNAPAWPPLPASAQTPMPSMAQNSNSFPAAKRTNEHFFEEFNSSLNNFSNNAAFNSTTHMNNADSRASTSTLNPFL